MPKKLKCPHCDRPCGSPAGLAAHIRHAHPVKTETPNAPETDPKHQISYKIFTPESSAESMGSMLETMRKMRELNRVYLPDEVNNCHHCGAELRKRFKAENELEKKAEKRLEVSLHELSSWPTKPSA